MNVFILRIPGIRSDCISDLKFEVYALLLDQYIVAPYKHSGFMRGFNGEPVK